MRNLPQPIDRDAPIFPIRIASQLAGMHAQTLRQYDRLGLVVPGRTAGRGRRYSGNDIVKLRLIQQLSQEEGINLNGIRRILELQTQLVGLQRRVEELSAVAHNVTNPRPPRTFTADVYGHVSPGRPRTLQMRALER